MEGIHCSALIHASLQHSCCLTFTRVAGRVGVSSLKTRRLKIQYLNPDDSDINPAPRTALLATHAFSTVPVVARDPLLPHKYAADMTRYRVPAQHTLWHEYLALEIGCHVARSPRRALRA